MMMCVPAVMSTVADWGRFMRAIRAAVVTGTRENEAYFVERRGIGQLRVLVDAGLHQSQERGVLFGLWAGAA